MTVSWPTAVAADLLDASGCENLVVRYELPASLFGLNSDKYYIY